MHKTFDSISESKLTQKLTYIGIRYEENNLIKTKVMKSTGTTCITNTESQKVQAKYGAATDHRFDF